MENSRHRIGGYPVVLINAKLQGQCKCIWMKKCRFLQQHKREWKVVGGQWRCSIDGAALARMIELRQRDTGQFTRL